MAEGVVSEAVHRFLEEREGRAFTSAELIDYMPGIGKQRILSWLNWAVSARKLRATPVPGTRTLMYQEGYMSESKEKFRVTDELNDAMLRFIPLRVTAAVKRDDSFQHLAAERAREWAREFVARVS